MVAKSESLFENFSTAEYQWIKVEMTVESYSPAGRNIRSNGSCAVEFINVEYNHKNDLAVEVESAAISGARFGMSISSQSVQMISIDRITGVADNSAAEASILASMHAFLVAINYDFMDYYLRNRDPKISNWILKYARTI